MSDNLLDLRITQRSLEHNAQGLVVQGELDINTSPQLKNAIDRAVEAGHRILVIDFTAVPYIDSTGLGVLVSRRKKMHEIQGSIVLITSSAHMLKVLDITGLNKLFAVYPSTEVFNQTYSPANNPALNLAAEIKQARQAAERYHHLLRDCYNEAFRAEFAATMTSGHLNYGGRPLCPFMRPHFITTGQVALVDQDMAAVMQALRKLGEQARQAKSLQDAMGITAEEQELIALPPGYDTPSAMSRLDTFLTDAGLQLVEYNAECPTGVGYNEQLYLAFMRLDLMRRFSREHPVQAADAMEDVLQALLRAYKASGGQRHPNIAIVDWSEVVTRGEFRIFEAYFEARGYPTRLADPRSLVWNGKRLSADGFDIDIVYRRVLTTEFLQKRSECKALEDAYRAQGACFVNNFQTKLLHKKLVFAALLNEKFLEDLPPDVAQTLRRCVPWTARLADGRVERRGQTIDLLETLLTERDRFVLKPNDDYGGRGITLGWQTTDALWDAALRTALQDEHAVWVVQERVQLWQEPFPDMEGHVASRYVDLDPFIFTDYYRGFLTRLSNAPISNVTAGAGQAPTFILNPQADGRH